MKLRFDSEDWLLIIMALRAAQKVLAEGPLATPAWDPQRADGIISELQRLIFRNKATDARAVTEVDLSAVAGTVLDPDVDLTPAAGTGPQNPACASRADLESVTGRLRGMEEETIKNLQWQSANLGALEKRILEVEDRISKFYDFAHRLEDQIRAKRK